MKCISAAIVVLSGAILLAVAGLLGRNEGAIPLWVAGILNQAFGLAVWNLALRKET